MRFDDHRVVITAAGRDSLRAVRLLSAGDDQGQRAATAVVLEPDNQARDHPVHPTALSSSAAARSVR